VLRESYIQLRDFEPFFPSACLRCHIFLHNFRSDVLGQFMPLVGKDWSQSGVARLFSAIKVIHLPTV